MAKYSDGVTEAEVGDIVKCVARISSMFKPLSGDCSYKVVQLFGDSVYLEYPNEHGFLCSRFELIKRTGAVPSPEPEQPAVKLEQSPEPLVKWPEEKRNELRWEHLEPGEYFVFDLDNYRDRIYFRCENGFIEGLDPIGRRAPKIEDVQTCSLFYPVRRVRMTTLPQFTVI